MSFTQQPSTYKLLQCLYNMADMQNTLRTFKFDTCVDGCTPFFKDTVLVHQCISCNKPRWKSCKNTCVDGEGDKICRHPATPVRSVYYMPVEDRLRKLLRSDIRNLFKYPVYRHKSSGDGLVQDFFDSTTYLDFNAIAPDDGEMIYLQVCWDGADMFNHAGKSMWPLCYSILNLPPSLRDKVHVGMHVASFDDGSDAATELFAHELLHLWETGFIVDGRKYYACCPQVVMDGRGREKFCKVQVK